MSHTLLPNIIEFLTHVDPFDKLPQDCLEKIAGCIKINYLGQGERIAFSTDQEECYLYIIRTGAMEQRKSDGVLRAKLGEQDIFGFSFLQTEGDSSHAEMAYTATAMENSLLYLIPHAKLKHILRSYPEYAQHFAAQAQVRIQSALSVVWSDDEKGLFFKTVAEVASDRVTVVPATLSIQQTAYRMTVETPSPLAVVKDGNQIVGVMTDRDLAKRVLAKCVNADRQIKEVMTPNPLIVSPDDLVMKAASLMMQHNVRSLPVVKDGQVVGVLSTTHLIQKHRVQAIFLIEKINYTDSLEDLVELASERQAIFEALIEGNVGSEIIGQVMAMIMDTFNRRILQLVEAKMGPPPCEYAWVVAGSHARNEVHALSDQDNAIILSDDVTDDQRMYFKLLAMDVCKWMDACGYSLCSGNYMASVQKWCQPLSVWKAYYTKWAENPEYDRLLNITVFLEVRAIHGHAAFSEELQAHLMNLLGENSSFLSILARDTVETQPPLGIFNKFVLEKNGDQSNTLNIKKYALNLIVDLARIYSLSVGCTLTGTEERFQYAFEHGSLSEESLKDIIGAYRFITRVRYSHQLQALKNGEVPDNHISPDMFGSFERKHLKDAFRIIAEHQDAVKLRYGQA
ncbi:CBS domain-containing protein [Photobacterium sp. BZF1]|uniref:putative nucleotidyltransferase substrate binding domain-containing protein n=1 Tax=Photobacterium sp. BZF1 TaxID=1904457 RepID=UPI00165385C4|nr:putative nucleotidyltransferase substrate binding domain-containing protein [Photobacterium sp. BZF1]MBC7005358.1 CBS domain-containing protein [Photobacterium sp. BZF1]